MSHPSDAPSSSSPPDDPRLTAYALGELAAIERRDVEAVLEADPSLVFEVDAIRAVAASLATALAVDAAAAEPAWPDARRDAVVEATARSRPAIQIRFGSGTGRWRLFNTAGAVVVLAGIAMLVGAPYLLMFVSNMGGAASMDAPASEYVADSGSDDGSPPMPGAVAMGGEPNRQLDPNVHLPMLNFSTTATAGLPYDLSITATALRSVISSTPEPQVPRTDGGKNEAAVVPPAAPVADPNRKIIKDATLAIEVDDTTAALGRIDTLAVQSGGYILETLTDQGADSGRPGATVKFAVPVGNFEAALGRLRAIGTVAQEQASGVDVTTEFTDIQSRIANLEATQARVREFLAQAKTVEEALNVNARLTEIEGQLAELKGRSTYLAGRAAYSTITVTLIGPVLPTRTPTITPTPTATPTPTPGTPWSPVPIAKDAFATLGGLLQGLAAVAIWLVVVGLPLGLIAAAGWWGVRGIMRRGR